MVCLGNICRSPMAQGILESKVKSLDLPWSVDSAGTSGWHDGEKPDKRAIDTCKKYGIDISGQRSRKLKQEDFNHFDLVLTMDKNNLDNVLKIAIGMEDKMKVRPLLTFLCGGAAEHEVPDPYYDNRFEEVYTLLNHAIDRLIEEKSLHFWNKI
jgi:protein-tyrosine phosphatase